jgi:hypothetical protein
MSQRNAAAAATAAAIGKFTYMVRPPYKQILQLLNCLLISCIKYKQNTYLSLTLHARKLLMNYFKHEKIIVTWIYSGF